MSQNYPKRRVIRSAVLKPDAQFECHCLAE